MWKISIFKVENPSCLWGRVVQRTTEQYDNLLAQMNHFYQDVSQQKPMSVEEGQVCVVYWSVMKSWCRAVVESIVMDMVSYQARCLLVDYGERLVVSSDQIRVAQENFLQLPFWMKRFHLAAIKPTTLRVSVDEKAELIPSSQWDSSATLYLHNLLQVSTQAEAVLLDCESDSTSIELYLMVANVKICVNDDLVAKKFALYSRPSAEGGGLDEVDQFPVMLPISLLTLRSTPNRTMAQTRPPDLAAASWPTTHSTLQSQQHDGSEVIEEELSADSQSKGGSECYAADSAKSEEQSIKALCKKSRSSLTDYYRDPTIPHEEHGDGEEKLTLTDRNLEQIQNSSNSSGDTDLSLATALTKNLNLFRFLKFLNPDISSFQERTPSMSKREELRDCGFEEASAAFNSQQEGGRDESSHTEQTRDVPQTSVGLMAKAWGCDLPPSPLNRPETEGEARSSDEAWACSRLLSWLNPEPLNPGPDEPPHERPQVVPSDPILVHSALPVEPCTHLDDAPITDHLRGVLQRKQAAPLSPADRHSWPAIARGCNTIVVSHQTEQPLSYLAPLLSHILLNSIFTSLTSSTGPIAVLLCPGWERVQMVFDLLEELKVTSSLHPATVLLGVGTEEAKAARIPKNCQLLLTTPFSLVRLVSCRCFLFLRLYHLVLDQADRLLTLAPDQMTTILQHFQKVSSSEEKTSCPQQIIAVAKRWTSDMKSLLTSHMSYPCVVITVPEEAALYANVQQIIRMVLETSKISVLLAALDFNPDIGQKTLIVTASAQEVEDVFKAVRNKSAFCLMIHEGLIDQSALVIQQWRKDIGPGSHVILVTTSDILKALGIRDATCVLHYDFPSSPKEFGSRLFCMQQNFRNLTERDQTDSCPHLTRSVLLISERNTRHVVGLLRYLVRTNAPLPPELVSFSQGVHMAREDQKTSQPLCSYLKSFGVCRDRSTCPDRHRVMLHLDHSDLPTSGIIEVVPLYIKTASVFYGRIVRKEDGGFHSMESQMNFYYAEQRPGASDVVEGGLYAVQVDGVFHRVKVLCVPDRVDRLFFSVNVRFIDVGKEEAVRSHQILHLPDQFHCLPPQAVEIIVCRIKPVDAEINWHPKVTRAIDKKIRGVQHRARAVLSLGNTVFVDPMVCLSQLPGMKTVINEYNVQSEILNTGMGISNPDHLDLLRKLWQDTTPLPCSNGPVSLDGLGEAFNYLAVPLHLEPCDPVNSVNPVLAPLAEPHHIPLCDHTSLLDSQSAAVQTNNHTADMMSVDQMRNGPEGEFGSSQTTAPNTCDNGDVRSSQRVISSSPETDGHKSFHPQIRWYQTSESVILTVKMTNPEAQRCEFYHDRVVYSGRVDKRTYRTDLQLQHNIAADSCSWEMKSNEPVLKLVKQQKGYWERLLRSKNIFVTYDMEHVEEEEDGISNGHWYVENTGEDNCMVASEESDND